MTNYKPLIHQAKLRLSNINSLSICLPLKTHQTGACFTRKKLRLAGEFLHVPPRPFPSARMQIDEQI